MDVRAYLLECAPRVEAALDRVLPPADEPPTTLHRAMRHLLFPAGKLLRPALATAAAEAVGAPGARALPVATAVELVHTYSLIHDDLPCMDDDDERRGAPTVHVAFDETTAVLAGDALQALAFAALADGVPEAGALGVARSLAALARAAGSKGLVGGQVDDLAFTPGGADEAQRVESVHARKSAALITAAVVGGAASADPDPGRLAALHKFGEEVGVAFQIADDLLDMADAEPCSLVRVLGEAGAKTRAQALLESALGRIGDLGETADALRELAGFAARRNR